MTDRQDTPRRWVEEKWGVIWEDRRKPRICENRAYAEGFAEMFDGRASVVRVRVTVEVVEEEESEVTLEG